MPNQLVQLYQGDSFVIWNNLTNLLEKAHNMLLSTPAGLRNNISRLNENCLENITSLLS